MFVKNFAYSFGCSSDVRDRDISVIFCSSIYVSVILRHAVPITVIN